MAGERVAEAVAIELPERRGRRVRLIENPDGKERFGDEPVCERGILGEVEEDWIEREGRNGVCMEKNEWGNG